MNKVIVEIGQSSRNYCELSGRTQPVIGDVIVALINMGISLQGIESFAKRDNRHLIPTPTQMGAQKQINLLQAGTKSAHPPYIPNHLPVLPDPHAYIRTPVILLIFLIFKVKIQLCLFINIYRRTNNQLPNMKQSGKKQQIKKEI